MIVARLREQAALCLRLAAKAWSPDEAERLRKLAGEYEANAQRLVEQRTFRQRQARAMRSGQTIA